MGIAIALQKICKFYNDFMVSQELGFLSADSAAVKLCVRLDDSKNVELAKSASSNIPSKIKK